MQFSARDGTDGTRIIIRQVQLTGVWSSQHSGFVNDTCDQSLAQISGGGQRARAPGLPPLRFVV
jgi:hypothetical protein